MSSVAMPRLGDILIRMGLLDANALNAALRAKEATGSQLGEFLVENGLVTRQQLGAALEEQFQAPFRTIEPHSINLQVARMLPERLARDRKLAPVQAQMGILTVAMTAPDDIEAISEAELITGYRVEPVVTLYDDLRRLFEIAFDETITARQTAVDLRMAELRAEKESGSDRPIDALPEEPDSPVVKLVRSILAGAVSARASDIHLEPRKPQMRVRYRVDGELQMVMTIPPQVESAVVGRIKVMANMDTTESRKAQDGALSIEDRDVRATFRVSTIPVIGGEKVVMRVVDEHAKVFSFDALGMPKKQVASVKALLDKPHGMIVVTGPTGSGKTTTMYTMLMSLNAEELNISTVEDPVEFALPGVNQVHADGEHGLGFAHALKYLMRQDPDVILVGEIRDAETASTAIQASLTGHLLISTLHTNDAVSTVGRLQDLGVDRYKVADCLLAAIAQRLLRKVCPSCKKRCEPNPLHLERLLQGSARKVPTDTSFYVGAGCPRCLSTGFAGRAPVYEIMTITPRLQRAIEKGDSNSALRDIAIAEGMIELAESGLDLALAGETSIDEIYHKLSL